MKTIVNFSGGLDSIYVLWKELTTTDNEVTAVYYSGENLTREQISEFPSLQITTGKPAALRWMYCQQIAEVMKKETRDFTLVKEMYDLSLLDEAEYAYSPLFRTLHSVEDINAGQYDRMISGISRDNDGWYIKGENDSSSSYRSMDCFIKKATRGEIAFPLLDSEYTPAHAFVELPESLLAIHRSCDTNLYSTKNISCHNCYKCHMHKYARKLMSEGKTPAEIYDIYTERSMMPNGMWKSQKIWLAEEINHHKPDIENNIYPVPKWGTYYKVPNSQ